MKRVLVALLVGLVTVAGCGAPAAPAAPTGGAPRAAAAGGAAPPAADSYRQQVIDGARREGEVNAAIQSSWTPEGLRELEAAIEREYGVRVKINYSPVQAYPQRLAELSSEVAAGVTPSFDLHQTSDATALMMLEQDLLDTTDWSALLPAGTPNVVQGDNRLVVIYTDHSGLIYDPTVIAAADVPRSLRDLGNPRWRGKFMLWQYPSAYLPWAVKLGREPLLAAVRAAVHNGASADTFANTFTRFTAKEYPMVMNIGSYYYTAKLRGVSAALAPLDISTNSDHTVAVPRRAAHPNAARLLAAVLAGPEGQRISDKFIGASSRYYEGSADYQLEEAARAAGFDSFSWLGNTEARSLALSPEGQELQRELDRILKGG